TRAPSTFTLAPPLDLNLKAGWPLLKNLERLAAERRYRQQIAPTSQTAMVAGIGASTPAAPPENALIRVEPAQQVEAPKIAVVPPTPIGKLGPTPKGGKLA